MDDLISVLVYVLFIVGAIVTSAYQAKKRKSLKDSGSFSGEPDQTKAGEAGPDFGPFSEFFDRSIEESQTPVYENLEDEPFVEEAGLDAEKSSAYNGMASSSDNKIEKPATYDTILAGDFRNEGQSDLERMDEDGNSQQQDYAYDNDMEDIAAGEIVSEEAAAEALSKKTRHESFNWRKGIIYSEILKRKEL